MSRVILALVLTAVLGLAVNSLMGTPASVSETVVAEATQPTLPQASIESSAADGLGSWIWRHPLATLGLLIAGLVLLCVVIYALRDFIAWVAVAIISLILIAGLVAAVIGVFGGAITAIGVAVNDAANNPLGLGGLEGVALFVGAIVVLILGGGIILLARELFRGTSA